MIFVTIGSAVEYKFPRLLRIIDELCDEGIIDGCEVIAQIGYTEYTPRNYKSFDMIADEDFKNLLNRSDIVITHAGTGSVTSALKMRKKVIVFPRLYKYQEHLDDHQIELADLFTSKGYTLSAMDKDQLRTALLKIDEFKPEPFISSNQLINKLIVDFIDSI